MTRTAEIVERLRAEEQRTQKLFDIVVLYRDRSAGQAFTDLNSVKHAVSGRDPVLEPAADHIETLARERDRAVEALERTLRNFRLLLEQKPVRDAAETIAEAERTLAQIDTESEGER